MAVVSDTFVVEPGALREFSTRLAEAMGATPAVAGEVARHVVAANLAGHDSHGVLRWSQYVSELDSGELDPAARIELLHGGPVTALFDAHRGFGQHSTMAATDWALEHGRQHGIAAAAIRHSMHIGRLGEYTERLALEGLVGIVTVGVAGPGSGTVAPFGGAARFLGTNPWSMAVPAEGRPPLVFDAATSTVAEGKVRLARARGVEVPAGTVRDPLAAALIGGLAMIADADPTPAGCMRPPETWGDRLAGVFVVAIDPAAFGDPSGYRRQVAAVLDRLVAVPPAPAGERVLVPGDVERATRERRQRDGIAVPAATWQDLTSFAERFGVPLPAARATA